MMEFHKSNLVLSSGFHHCMLSQYKSLTFLGQIPKRECTGEQTRIIAINKSSLMKSKLGALERFFLDYLRRTKVAARKNLHEVDSQRGCFQSLPLPLPHPKTASAREGCILVYISYTVKHLAGIGWLVKTTVGNNCLMD